MRMAQEIRFGSCLLDPRLFACMHVARGAQQTMGGPNRLHLLLQAAVSVDKRAMACRLDERALVVLAMNLNDFLRDRTHRLRADRLVVDESPGASVGKL